MLQDGWQIALGPHFSSTFGEGEREKKIDRLKEPNCGRWSGERERERRKSFVSRVGKYFSIGASPHPQKKTHLPLCLGGPDDGTCESLNHCQWLRDEIKLVNLDLNHGLPHPQVRGEVRFLKRKWVLGRQLLCLPFWGQMGCTP